MDPSAPLATAEFLVVDTETNGLGGGRCELTEVGAVLVGGGELHDRWDTLVAAPTPLARGIQRFTGITQAMVDQAPRAEDVLPELSRLIEGRVLVAHSASFDRRVLRQAFERAGVAWPAPPVLCTVALARRFAPLVRQRRLALLAGSLGIEVEVQHRALPDAETCARVFCALFTRLCASATTIEDALAATRPARPRRVRAGGTDGGRSLRGARKRRPDVSGLPDEPGVYIFRNASGQPLYVGKSVTLRTRARAHCAPSADARTGGCLSPCLHDLGPTGYRRRLDDALGLFTARADATHAVLAHVDEQMRAAAREEQFERAAWLRRRRERLAVLLSELGGMLAATHARPWLVLAEHPRGGSWDAFWLVGGRVA